MNLRRAVFIAACMFAVAAGPAAAQFQPPPQQQPAAAQSPWPDQQPQQPQQSPWPDQQPQQSQWPQQQAPAAAQSPWTQQQQEPPCLKDFAKLRDEAQRRAGLIRTASERKASAKEACALFNAFSAAELKMIKYATDNAATCGIPPQVVTQMKQGHAKTGEIRTKVCQAAAAPLQQAAPSLSDALAAPVTDSNNIKTGRGTFDTLTGTPLGK
jgi:hypothetical protein